MKIFITGASGFIGRNLVNQLAKEGHELCVNIRKPITDLPENVTTYNINENDILSTINFFKTENFDGIIHLASLYITTHRPEDVVSLIDSNVRFSAFVLEASVNAKIPWFINTGTFWQHYENKEYSPVNLYAATKQAFESIAQYYWETNQIKFCTLKLSDTYGPNDTRQKIFNLWQRIANTGESFEMSPGEQIVDITFVKDVVSAFILLAHQLNNNYPFIRNGNVFAVKAVNRYSLKQLASIFEKTTEKKLNIRWGRKPYREREVMIPWSNGKNVPDWKPVVNIIDGIKLIFKD